MSGLVEVINYINLRETFVGPVGFFLPSYPAYLQSLKGNNYKNDEATSMIGDIGSELVKYIDTFLYPYYLI